MWRSRSWSLRQSRTKADDRVQDARYLRKVRGKLEEDLESKWLVERRIDLNRKLDRKKTANLKEKEQYREIVLSEHTAIVLNKTKEMDSIITKTQKVAKSIIALHRQENCREKILAEKYIDHRRKDISMKKVKLQPKLDVKPRVENMNKLDQLVRTALQGFQNTERTALLKTDDNITASTFRTTRRTIESKGSIRSHSSITRPKLASLDQESDAKCIEIIW
jgi:hypothetical protein